MFSAQSLLLDFPQAFRQLLPQSLFNRLAKKHGPRGAGKPSLTLWQWFMSRTYHELPRVGNFSDSVKSMTRVSVSDSALSQRAQSVGCGLFEAILPAVLKPLAKQEKHPEAFHQGYRLCALDGLRFNLRNTKTMNAKAIKTPCSNGSGEPAFAHLLGVVLVELGHHQPLGASFGWDLKGEQTHMRRLFEKTSLPEKSLLLCDRLYGTPLVIWDLKPRLKESDSEILMRVKFSIKSKRLKQLSDGSWLVEVPVTYPNSKRKQGTLILREIEAEIHYEGNDAPLKMRLWTTLLDEKAHPAEKMVELYATRWEEELFFRELKSHLHHRGNLLDAQTPETAVQEVMSMLLAASLIAHQRDAVAAEAGVPIINISFAKVYAKIQPLYEMMEVGRDLFSEEALAIYAQRILEDLSTSALIKKRPGRSCQRSLRQPVKDWPKTRNPTSKIIKKTIIIANP
jgi:hypothetical protein